MYSLPTFAILHGRSRERRDRYSEKPIHNDKQPRAGFDVRPACREKIPAMSRRCSNDERQRANPRASANNPLSTPTAFDRAAFAATRRLHHGGADRDRTDDLKLAKLALSQLSYGPAFAKASAGKPNKAALGRGLPTVASAKVGGPGKI